MLTLLQGTSDRAHFLSRRHATVDMLAQQLDHLTEEMSFVRLQLERMFAVGTIPANLRTQLWALQFYFSFHGIASTHDNWTIKRDMGLSIVAQSPATLSDARAELCSIVAYIELLAEFNRGLPNEPSVWWLNISRANSALLESRQRIVDQWMHKHLRMTPMDAQLLRWQHNIPTLRYTNNEWDALEGNMRSQALAADPFCVAWRANRGRYLQKVSVVGRHTPGNPAWFIGPEDVILVRSRDEWVTLLGRYGTFWRIGDSGAIFVQNYQLILPLPPWALSYLSGDRRIVHCRSTRSKDPSTPGKHCLVFPTNQLATRYLQSIGK